VPHSRIGIATTKTSFELKGKTDLNLFEGAGLVFSRITPLISTGQRAPRHPRT